MSSREFASSLQKLQASWDLGHLGLGPRSLLERLDELGLLQPIHRFVVPSDYVKWRWSKYGGPQATTIELSVEAVEYFGKLEGFLENGWMRSASNEPFHEGLETPDELAALDTASANEKVDWATWDVVVGDDNGKPIHWSRAFAYYGRWQIIDCLAILDRLSASILLRPTEEELKAGRLWLGAAGDYYHRVLYTQQRPIGFDSLTATMRKDGWTKALDEARYHLDVRVRHLAGLASFDGYSGSKLNSEELESALSARLSGSFAGFASDKALFIKHIRSLMWLWHLAPRSARTPRR